MKFNITFVPVVFLLSLSEDEVGHDEGREDNADWFPDPPEGVGKPLGEGSGESLLLQGRNVVLGGPSDGHAEVTKAEPESSEWSPHDWEELGLDLQ